MRSEMPALEEIGQYYRSDYLDQFREEQVGNARSSIYQHVLEELALLQPEKGLLVDVGCGAGALLALAEERGWYAEGFDISEEGINIAKERGLKASFHQWVPCPLPDEHVDAITFINVLDHLPDPFPALKEAWRVLKPGGVLYVRVPNSPVHLGLRTALSYFGLRHLTVFHLFGFSRKSFCYHLPKLGFSILNLRTSPPSHGEAYHETKGRKIGLQKLLKTIDRQTQSFLATSGLDHKAWGLSIEVIARKTAHPHD